MNESLTGANGNARVIEREFSQRLLRLPLKAIADAIGKSDSTADRIRKGEQALSVSEWCAVLSAARFKIVDEDAYTVDGDIYRATCAITSKAMGDPAIARLVLQETK
jgi:hypothetical protein